MISYLYSSEMMIGWMCNGLSGGWIGFFLKTTIMTFFHFGLPFDVLGCILFNSSGEFSSVCCIHRFEEVNMLGTVLQISCVYYWKESSSNQMLAKTCRMEKDFVHHFQVLAKTSRSTRMKIRHKTFLFDIVFCRSILAVNSDSFSYIFLNIQASKVKLCF